VLDRLSLLDASFLERERAGVPLHTGAVSVFGPQLRFEAVLETLRDRLPRIPRARARVAAPSRPLGGRPVWVDDPEFDLTFHLRHAALPAPGGRAQLADYLARLMARPLDRARPLWELYVVEGLAGDRVAVFRKVHLAMAGGDRGDPFAVLLDESADTAPSAPEARPWRAAPGPGTAERTVGATRDRLEQVTALGREATRLAVHPTEAAVAAATTAGDLARLASRLVGRAPRSPLNRRLGQHRRLSAATLPLDDLRRVRGAFGGTVNDVVVTVCADAVGRLLRSRGHDTTDLDLRVMLPVRVHADGDGGSPSTVGEGVVAVLAPLPVMQIDPVARLYRVMGELAGLKESRQAVAAEGLVRLAGFAPPNLHSAAARMVTAEQRYTVALSNAPGPQEPRYLGGAQMEQTCAFLPLAGDSALSIAVTSYLGTVYVGMVGERDAMPDLDALAGFLPDALADLVAAAG